MKIKTKIFSLVITAVLIFSLFIVDNYRDGLRNNALQSINGGGAIITFDDRSILDWYEVDQVLDKYNWKATFFISHFHSLDFQDKQRLKTLQSKGHEIASHGNKHINATKFISTNSIDEYIDVEILPSINEMKKEGFLVSSFAYPYGARSTSVELFHKITCKIKTVLFGHKINALDRKLLSNFAIIRGTTYGKKYPSLHNNFANGSRVVFGLGIDESYGNDIDYLYKVLRHAKENNKIAIFYSHRVSKDINPSVYTSTYKTLEGITKYIVKNNMHFMTMKDLVN